MWTAPLRASSEARSEGDSRLPPDAFDLEELRALGAVLGTGGLLDREHLSLEAVLAIVSGGAEGTGGGDFDGGDAQLSGTIATLALLTSHSESPCFTSCLNSSGPAVLRSML